TGLDILSLSGSGSTRLVTVSTGTGSGTLRLDVPENAVIADLDENLLSDLPFEDGEIYHIRTQNFADVPPTSGFWQWIERLYTAGITGGCGVNPLTYCVDNPVKRSEMAIFLERGMRGSSFVPPDATGVIFSDVWPTSFAADWIEQLYGDGITSGCGQGAYCPNDAVTRAQMAIFLLRAKYGSDYEPPAEGNFTGFADVAPGDFAAAWIKQLAAEGITSGCGGYNYCPDQAVTRAQMAVFLVRTFELP
ncbi:MAG: S-layer homology domain-containing protein, partial [Anaerolineales bacterium]